jgi:hypothetical protein
MEAKGQEPSQRLAPSLQKTTPKQLLMWVATMALRRGCSLSPEELELRRDDLLNPRSYAAQLAGRDVAIEPEDFDEAMYALGTATRDMYEQAWPPLDITIAAVLEAAKQRRIVARDARVLTDGRRPGEDDFAFRKRRWEEDKANDDPNAEAEWRASLDALNAKLAMPTQAVRVPTQGTQDSTVAPRDTLRGMRPSYVNSVITILNELEKMATDEGGRDYEIAMSLLRTVSERSTVATAMGVLRVYWPDVVAERKAAEADASKPQ